MQQHDGGAVAAPEDLQVDAMNDHTGTGRIVRRGTPAPIAVGNGVMVGPVMAVTSCSWAQKATTIPVSA